MLHLNLFYIIFNTKIANKSSENVSKNLKFIF